MTQFMTQTFKSFAAVTVAAMASLAMGAEQPTWRPTIACDNSAMVVDQAVIDNEAVAQLVIRRADAIQNFASQISLGGLVNNKGELIVRVLALGDDQFASEPTSEMPAMFAVSRENGGTRVRLMQGHYYGRSFNELANWFFPTCN